MYSNANQCNTLQTNATPILLLSAGKNAVSSTRSQIRALPAFEMELCTESEMLSLRFLTESSGLTTGNVPACGRLVCLTLLPKPFDGGPNQGVQNEMLRMLRWQVM